MRIMSPGATSLSVSRDALRAHAIAGRVVEAYQLESNRAWMRGAEIADAEIEAILSAALGTRQDLRERVIRLLEADF